ncbi:peptidyl-prolyl cis-trans isomerase, partial [Francisella tularensis subsp. holarctica]|nr:peptidyl-prolyl cis-trans isomerase [Francisella tularensis subsp. holarctica]
LRAKHKHQQKLAQIKQPTIIPKTILATSIVTDNDTKLHNSIFSVNKYIDYIKFSITDFKSQIYPSHHDLKSYYYSHKND